MKHFLDFGTHRFQGLNEFTSKLSIDKEWSVQCYEANPYTYDLTKEKGEKISERYKSFSHNNKAVMDQAGTITVHCHKGSWDNGVYKELWTSGSNVLDDTPTYDAVSGVIFDIVDAEVECIAIEDILAGICKEDPEAEIYIKCDIEGSEFAVLPKIIDSDYKENIVEMYVEWHERFWFEKGEYQEKVRERQYLEGRLKRLGVKMYTHR